MRWPWTRAAMPGTEDRNYTDAVVEALLSAAGKSVVSAARTAAMETASGLWARAFASATVTPGGARAALGPGLLAHIGRALCRTGNGLLYIDMTGGLTLRPVHALTVWGGVDRRTWRYDFELPAPGGAVPMRRIASEDMVHVRYSYSESAPWQGLGPMEWASATGQLMGAMEERLQEESASPVGYLIPIPKSPVGDVVDSAGNTIDPMATLRNELKALRGRTALVETLEVLAEGIHRGGGPDWTPRRVGSNPPPSVIALRDEAERSVLSACGIPPGLSGLGGGGQGTQAREDWRRFLHGTIAPVAALVQEELAQSLPWADITIGFDRLFASDLQGRARAFQSMASSGMDLARAAALSGLMEAD